MSEDSSPIARIKMAAVDSAFFLLQEAISVLKRYEGILAVVGLLYVGKIAGAVTCRLYEGVRVHILARLWKTDLRRFGEWALVTGSTDGIGKEYARQLAKRGLNIILMSRTLEKLQATANELERDFGVKTFIVQADLSQGREIYRDIADKLRDKEIGILINNAGVMLDSPTRFADVPEQAFVDWFSMALDYEYKDKGIIVQSLIPSYISTKLVKFSNVLSTPSFMVPDAPTFVNHAVNTITYSKRTTGFWSHGLQYWACEHIPQWFWNLEMWYVFKMIDNSKDASKQR